MKYLFLICCLLLIILPFIMIILNHLNIHWIGNRTYFTIAGLMLLLQEFYISKGKNKTEQN